MNAQHFVCRGGARIGTFGTFENHLLVRACTAHASARQRTHAGTRTRPPEISDSNQIPVRASTRGARARTVFGIVIGHGEGTRARVRVRARARARRCPH